MAEMNVLLLPCESGQWLLFPQEIIGSVYPFAPTLNAEETSEFVIGSMLIQSEKIPVLDFQFKSAESAYEGTLRLIVIETITTDTPYRRYAVKSYGEPELFTLQEEALQAVGAHPHRYCAQVVQIAGREAREILLLNLPRFEKELKMR